jgi:16S rRNA processing protein RimM
MRDGEKIGEVTHVDHLPAQDLLIVKSKGREVMVPFVSAIVPEVDVAAGTITVTPPAGLFEELPESDEADATPASDAGPDESEASRPRDAPAE